MPQRACNTCGRSFTPKSPAQRRCPTHQGRGTGYSHNRDRAKQARFRAQLLLRAGRRCERIEQGRRCTTTKDLRACHLVALADGGSYDLSNGELLCRAHDRASDSRAR